MKQHPLENFQAEDAAILPSLLERAIDPHPLTVPPETRVMDVIYLMSVTHGHSCTLGKTLDSGFSVANSGARSSCVLVTQNQVLLGIWTERDIVRLTAKGVDLSQLVMADVMVSPVITLSQSAFQDVFAALFLFRRYRIRHLVIVNDGDQKDTEPVVGIVSPESIRRALRPTHLLKLRRVSEVMSTDVIQASRKTSVLELAKLMSRHQVSSVVITDMDLLRDATAIKPVGIVTERDIVQFQALDLNLAQTTAETVMSTPLFLLNPSDSLWTAHQSMQRHRVQRLVVSWDWGQQLGIVTQTSLLRVFDPLEMAEVVEALQRTVQQLELEKAQMKQVQEPSRLTDAHEAITQPQGLALSNHPALRGDLRQELSLLSSQTLIERSQFHLKELMHQADLSHEVVQRYITPVMQDLQSLQQRIQPEHASIDP